MRFSYLIALVLLGGSSLAQDGSYYQGPALFSTRPSETKSLQTIKRFGPVGLGIDLLQPAFVMRISNVEEGSPAAAAGGLKKGQIIESINGQSLKDIDPRIQLGQILAQAEAGDGRVVFAIKGEAEPVVVTIPVLGEYSSTWPLDCPKSDKIVRQVADYLSQPDATEGLGGIGMLFLLSTGEDKDLAVVHEWARKAPAHTYPWYIGYGGIPLAECYLRTGDPEILANIQKWVDNASKSQHNDAWAGRGSALTGYGNGHLNAAGTHVLTFLLLARECGAEVPYHTLERALRHFYRYAGRGNNPYGDDRPFTGFVDNGKNGKLAFAMAAAAALTPEGEASVYARARDACAMQSFYTTTFMLHGHTGGGIGEIGELQQWACCMSENQSSIGTSWTAGNGTMTCRDDSMVLSGFSVEQDTIRSCGVLPILSLTRFHERRSVSQERRRHGFQSVMSFLGNLGEMMLMRRFFHSMLFLLKMEFNRIFPGRLWPEIPVDLSSEDFMASSSQATTRSVDTCTIRTSI